MATVDGRSDNGDGRLRVDPRSVQSGDRTRRASGECNMHPIMEQNLTSIQALAREYGVARLEVFGSVCTPEFDPERSDVDFLVEYPDDYDFGPWLGRVQDLQQALADLLGYDVDLVMISALRNKWFRRLANETRTVVYDAAQVPEVA
jgi:uncharacterized protein